MWSLNCDYEVYEKCYRCHKKFLLEKMVAWDGRHICQGCYNKLER